MRRYLHGTLTCATSLLALVSRLVKAAPTEVPSAASFYVPYLPGLHQDATHPLHIYAGHILSDPDADSAASTDVLAHLFFVMVKARRSADKERLIFWFNGGPGCSSFDGLMMEIGPWRADEEGGLKIARGGWNEYTTMVYVDQPAGTGFSYTSTNNYVHSIQQATDQLMEFLRTFYKVFPEYETVDTYLGGESYAGQYIPYFADAILSSELKMHLRGAAIGNGWTDARNQYPSYIDYAVMHGLVDESSQHYKDSKDETNRCIEEFRGVTMEPIHTNQCERLLMFILQTKARTVDGQPKCVNIYDVRLEDDQPFCGLQWPPELHNISTYLNRRDVVRALHAEDKPESWVECSGRVSDELHEYLSPSAITLLPSVLEKIPVLLFAGDQDYICNYMGIENMIKSMTWNGEKGLGKVQTKSWTVDGTPAGTWVSSRNLTYAKLFNASHMAPYDVPDVAHDMILRFMGMDFSAIVDGSARIPSAIGDDAKPIFMDSGDVPLSSSLPGKTPEQTKAQWDAYYNAGSVVLIFLLLAIAIGLCIWCRLRRRPVRLLRNPQSEENIPLNGYDDEQAHRKRKGKERALENESGTAIFDVGEDEEEYVSDDVRKGRID